MTTRRHQPQVTIVGNKQAGRFWTPEVASMAYQTGRFAAQQGFVVVTGGLSGVMLEGARGAFEAGGTVIGILPVTELRHANPYITHIVPTNLHFGRNILSVLSGDCVVALPGGGGTLQEVSYALTYQRPVFAWDGPVPPADIQSQKGLVTEYRDRSDIGPLASWLVAQYDAARSRIVAAGREPWAPPIND